MDISLIPLEDVLHLKIAQGTDYQYKHIPDQTDPACRNGHGHRAIADGHFQEVRGRL